MTTENKLIFAPPLDTTSTQPVSSCVNFQPSTSTNREGCWMLYGVHVNANKMLQQPSCNLFYRFVCLQTAETKTILHNKICSWCGTRSSDQYSQILKYQYQYQYSVSFNQLVVTTSVIPWSGFVFEVYCGVFIL